MSRVRSVAHAVILLVRKADVAVIVSVEGWVRLMLVLSDSGGGMTIPTGVWHCWCWKHLVLGRSASLHWHCGGRVASLPGRVISRVLGHVVGMYTLHMIS